MIVVQTPLRISLAGGGTDFKDFWEQEGGAVLSTAIDKYVYVIVKARFDEKIYINYSRKEIVDTVDEIEHELVREAMRMTGVKRGVEITTLADVPSEGSGLGSSSAITVGLLHTLYTYQGRLVDAERLAREACEIEIDILKRPIGIQDQYIAAYGNLRIFRFHRDGTVDVEKLELTESQRRRLALNLRLYFLGKTRSSSDILGEQKANIGRRLPSLRRLRDLVDDMKGALLSGDFDRVGRLLHQGWLEKKRLALKISNDEIDSLYQRAREAGGLGGKVVGAGGGGFLLLYCPGANHERLSEVLSDLRELPFDLERDGSKVIFNIRGQEWK